ncbi:MAG TPA: glycosyltransferase [Mycobacteriales bacterium]|jgi:glycosyltransferase involved in cell wall biosynthesis|nr:glycosyltransferase [Mycobacteriales bacterium]
MTVAYTVERFPVLSQTFVRNEIAELRRQGVDVVVAALWRGDDLGDEQLPAPYLVGARPRSRRTVAREHLRWLVRRPAGYVRFVVTARRLGEEARRCVWRRLPGLAAELDRQGVDRLHAHFAWGGAALAMLLSKLTGWPWALTVHAADIFVDRRNLELKLRDTDLLVTVCDYNADYLREQLGLQREVAKVICGVEVPPMPAPAERSIDLLFIGRLVSKKGVDVLLQAFATVAATRPATRLDIVGTGPLLADLTELAATRGVADRVTFRGAVPHDEVLDLLADARVLCLPARVAPDGDVDSMPLVIKEAMARCTAVVASDAGGVAEMVDETTGLLVPPDDADALAAALAKVLDDDDLRAQLAAAGRARVEAEFSLPGEVAKLRGLLNAMR